MKKNDILRALLLMVVIVGLTVGAAFALNIPTSKAIKERKEAEVKAYFQYFEGAESLEDITEEINPSAASGVQRVIKETSGKGYIVDVEKKGFSDNVKVIVTISSEGIILNIHTEIAAADFPISEETINSFVGENSNLSNVVLTAGATVSSTAVKDSVAAAFEVLIAKGELKPAEKTVEEIAEELITTVHPSFQKGVALATNSDVYKAYSSKDGSTVAHLSKGDAKFLAIADSEENIKVYEIVAVNADTKEYQLVDATSANSDLVEKVEAYLEFLELQSLVAVFPGAEGFVDVTTTLTLGSEIVAVYTETSGKGYVVIATAPGFQGHPVTVTVGITTEGLITGLTSEVTAGDWNISEENTQSFIGQDSTLSDVILTGKATHSATGVKNAVNNAFLALSSNGMIKAAEKSIEQVFAELLPTVTSGFLQDFNEETKANNFLTVSGNIYTAYVSHNKSVMVSYVNKGSDKLLAVTNVNGLTKVYAPELLNEDTQEYKLNDVTAENADVVEEVTTFASANLSSSFTKLSKKVKNLYKNNGVTDEVITEIKLNTMSTVLAALSFEMEGATYYAYYAKTYSFSNEIMDVYVILDSEGKIVKVDFSKFFFEEQFFNDKPEFNKGEYVEKFPGLDSSTLGEATLVNGATLSSNAVKQALTDAFGEFSSKGGNN